MECRFNGGPRDVDGSLELSVSPSELASSPESASEGALPLPLPVPCSPFLTSGPSHVGSSGSPSSCETLNLMCEELRFTLVPANGFKFLLARFFAEWDLLSLTRWLLDLFLLPTTWCATLGFWCEVDSCSLLPEECRLTTLGLFGGLSS